MRLLGSLALAGLAFSLTGCTRLQIKTGVRVPIASLAITTINATLPSGPGIAPGEHAPLVVNFTAPDGTTLSTEGAGHGKILWQDIAITSSVVSVRKGIVTLSDDPRATFGQTGHLDITVPTHTDLHATLDIPIRYDFTYALSLSGSNGLDGTNGLDGSDGANGSMGSFDPDHPSAGGNGGNGTSGANGTDGSNGSDGAPLRVRMAVMPGTRPMVEVALSSGNSAERFYLLDPAGGQLRLSTEGGRGGTGGRGGRAGRGGQGGAGSPNGAAGSDGSAGSNGSDGRAGSDGQVTVLYDPAAQPYLGLVKIFSSAPTVYRTQSIGPLW